MRTLAVSDVLGFLRLETLAALWVDLKDLDYRQHGNEIDGIASMGIALAGESEWLDAVCKAQLASTGE